MTSLGMQSDGLRPFEENLDDLLREGCGNLMVFLQPFKAMAFGAAMASFDCAKLQSALVTARSGNHCV